MRYTWCKLMQIEGYMPCGVYAVWGICHLFVVEAMWGNQKGRGSKETSSFAKGSTAFCSSCRDPRKKQLNKPFQHPLKCPCPNHWGEGCRVLPCPCCAHRLGESEMGSTSPLFCALPSAAPQDAATVHRFRFFQSRVEPSVETQAPQFQEEKPP